MLPAGAFAVVLMLGGAQIMLPAPAFVEQGRVWAPAREVLQRVGCKVQWQPQARAFAATRAGRTLSFPDTPPPWPTPLTPDQACYARRLGNLLYIPLLALRALGLQAAWDAPERRVVIRDETPTPTPLAAILSDPMEWLDRTVVLTGEYLGWDSYPFCYATRAGPPVASGDWVLSTDDRAIYCTPQPAPAQTARTGLTAAQSSAPVLTPYDALGRRVTVTGRVALAPSGVPYLRHESVALVTGAAGVSCELVLNQQACAPGDQLGWELVIHNPGPGSLSLRLPEQMLLSVAAPGGQLYVSKQSVLLKTLAPPVPAQDERRLYGEWRVPADAPMGTYSIIVSLDEGLRSTVRHFEVVRSVSSDAS